MMKAIPMRGRLTGKRIAGTIWSGKGERPLRKEHYFQVEDDSLVTAAFESPSGKFVVRCRGASCEVKLHGSDGYVLGTNMLVLPHGPRRLSTGDVARVRRRRRKRAARPGARRRAAQRGATKAARRGTKKAPRRAVKKRAAKKAARRAPKKRVAKKAARRPVKRRAAKRTARRRSR